MELKKEEVKKEEPKGVFQKVLSKGYSIFLLSMFVFVFIFRKLLFKNLSVKAFWFFTIVVFIWGNCWNLFINNIFSEKCWIFPEYSFLGISWLGQILEDWIFYLANPLLFIIVIDFFKNMKDWDNKVFQWAFFIFLLFCSIFFSFLDIAGLSITLFFTLPTFVILFLCSDIRKQLNGKILCSLFLFAIVFAGVWDLWGTTIKHEFFNYSWAFEWVYNKKFFNVSKLCWIFNSPISITPYYAIGIFSFTYFWYLLSKKLYPM